MNLTDFRELVSSLGLDDNAKIALLAGKVGLDDYQLVLVTSDGALVSEDNAGNGGWNDYTMAASSIPLAHSSAPALSLFRDGLYLPAFVGTGGNVKDAFVSIHIEHDYKPGTSLYPHVHWSHKVASPSGSVKWGIEYSVSKGHQLGVFPSSTTVYLTQAAGATYTHHIVEVSDGDAIPSTNVEPDSVVLLRLFRDPTDGGDTFEDDAFLVAVDLHYRSTGLFTNEKVSPF